MGPGDAHGCEQLYVLLSFGAEVPYDLGTQRTETSEVQVVRALRAICSRHLFMMSNIYIRLRRFSTHHDAFMTHQTCVPY